MKFILVEVVNYQRDKLLINIDSIKFVKYTTTGAVINMIDDCNYPVKESFEDVMAKIKGCIE